MTQRTLVTLLSLSAAVVICSCSGANQQTQPRPQNAAEILAQEEAWAAALVDSDLDTVASMMHRDFRLVRTYGDTPPISKEMYLGMEGMSASSAEVTSVTIIEEAGPVTVARVTWSLDWEQEGVGKLPPHFDMIDTWIKGEDGVWRILARISQVADGPYRAQEARQ